MAEPLDQRLVKLVRELDAERQRRVKAEREATGLRSVLTRMKRLRTADAAKRQPEQHAGC